MIEKYNYSRPLTGARNLYVAVQPAVADACWPMSKMDFRSNEADRTVSGSHSAHGQAGFETVTPTSFATSRGRRSFVAHHENRDSYSRLYRRAETLPRRLYHGIADQPGRTRSWRRQRG